MSLDSAIGYFRRQQARQFIDAATVTRPTGPKTLNKTTGRYEQDTDDVYDGPCKIRPASRQGNDVETGQIEIRIVGYVAKFPVDTDIHKGDTVTCTASTYDEALVGMRFTVTDVLADSWQVARVAILDHEAGDETEGGS